MSDSSDLAGVIGTWVAVGLAIMALLGIITPIVLLREARSDRFHAINAVDTQDTGYVRGGFQLHRRRGARERYFQRVRVPILTSPPRFDLMPRAPTSDAAAATGTAVMNSATGWVNFASLVQMYAPDVPLGDALRVMDRDTWLPVHCFWLLVVGLLGRYGKRDDRGLSINPDNAMRLLIERPGAWRNDRAVYGITGAMVWTPPSLEPVGSATFAGDRLYFKVHSVQAQGSLVPDPTPLPLLFWLALGCLPVLPENCGVPARVFDLAHFTPSLISHRTSTRKQQFFRYKQRNGALGSTAAWADATGVDMSCLWSCEEENLPRDFLSLENGRPLPSCWTSVHADEP
ncbi:hypothetical protein V2A60_009484 [Cordyceps javanica]